MFSTNKALIGGTGAALGGPFANVVDWLLQNFVHMPAEISGPFAAALVGLIIGYLTYLIPNVAPSTTGN